MLDDTALLRRYAESGSKPDFAELVRRHLNLVHAVALRQTNGDSHLAQDATQMVFTDLARQAGRLARHPVLSGWLFTSTRYAAAKLVRGEQRRRRREQEAQRMNEDAATDSSGQVDWDRVRPVLDEALGELAERDRHAILLRFFEGRDYAGVGAQLALTDNAARMRVDRAVDKLRALLRRRGITSTSAALAAALAGQAVTAAPAGLAASVTSAALATPIITGTVSALSLMSMAKLQVGLTAALIVAGTGIYTLQERTAARLKREIAALQRESMELAEARADRTRFQREADEVERLRGDDAELTRLQDSVAALKIRLQQLVTASDPAGKPAGTARPSGTPLNVSALDQLPRPLLQKSPVYPSGLRRIGESGRATVSFVIGTDGAVYDAKVDDFTHDAFATAALEAVRQWKFAAGRQHGVAVNSKVRVPIVFTLPGKPTSDGWF